MFRFLSYFFLFLGLAFVATGVAAEPADHAVKNDLIVGVFHFNASVSLKQVAETATKLNALDSNFKSIIVSQLHKDSYGIYFQYFSNPKINDTVKFVEMTKAVFVQYGKNYEGHQISNSSMVIK